MHRSFLKIASAALVVLSLVGALAAQQAKPEVALRAAMETETIKGDLKSAIEQVQEDCRRTRRRSRSCSPGVAADGGLLPQAGRSRGGRTLRPHHHRLCRSEGSGRCREIAPAAFTRPGRR